MLYLANGFGSLYVRRLLVSYSILCLSMGTTISCRFQFCVGVPVAGVVVVYGMD